MEPLNTTNADRAESRVRNMRAALDQYRLGKTHAEVAQKLGITVRTLRSYRSTTQWADMETTDDADRVETLVQASLHVVQLAIQDGDRSMARWVLERTYAPFAADKATRDKWKEARGAASAAEQHMDALREQFGPGHAVDTAAHTPSGRSLSELSEAELEAIATVEVPK